MLVTGCRPGLGRACAPLAARAGPRRLVERLGNFLEKELTNRPTGGSKGSFSKKYSRPNDERLGSAWTSRFWASRRPRNPACRLQAAQGFLPGYGKKTLLAERGGGPRSESLPQASWPGEAQLYSTRKVAGWMDGRAGGHPSGHRPT